MTKLESWLEDMKGPGWPSHPRSKEAIAVIEKLKEALEEVQRHSNSYDEFGNKCITKIAVLAIDPGNL